MPLSEHDRWKVDLPTEVFVPARKISHSTSLPAPVKPLKLTCWPGCTSSIVPISGLSSLP
jgi:hypothetical protein